ncbi:MAG TPA: NUDIX hydrolase [Candidatus Thermoplasmatota archaeon]|nr:NUDIX hydrolase [Candidatus Thermoplasmatota archaeon]
MGTFAWFGPRAPPLGSRDVPAGGLCLSAFLAVRDDQGRVLLGKYNAEDAKLEGLTGMDEERRKRFSGGWTLPARHLRFGESPETAARSIADDLVRVRVEPRFVRYASEAYESAVYPGTHHWDVNFLFEAQVPRPTAQGLWPHGPPSWYRELAFVDPSWLKPGDWARSHEDVWAMYAAKK